MKNVIANIKNSKGFVSLESILVIGVIIVLAGIILVFFNKEATSISTESASQTGTAKVDQGTAGTFSVTPQ